MVKKREFQLALVQAVKPPPPPPPPPKPPVVRKQQEAEPAKPAEPPKPKSPPPSQVVVESATPEEITEYIVLHKDEFKAPWTIVPTVVRRFRISRNRARALYEAVLKKS